MKKLFLLLVPIFLMISCVYMNGERIRGNGTLSTQQRTVTDFNAVSSSGSFDVYVSNGTTPGVRIEAEENLQEYIETTVEGSQLKVRVRDGIWLRPRRSIKVFVTAPAYNNIALHGSGNLISENRISGPSKISLSISGSGNMNVDLDAPESYAEMSGSGDINLKGETRKFEGVVNGSGNIKAIDLKTEESSIQINGSGNADVFASTVLNVEVRGSGDVRYKGGARVVSDIKGSGSVAKID